MKYLKNRQEFLTGVIEYKESYRYKSEDIQTSSIVKEALENDITWGGSLLGRLINSTIRKAVIGAKVFRVNPMIKKLRAQLESLEGDYLGKEQSLADQSVIYALFEAIKKAAIKPEPLDVFLKDGGLIDELVRRLDDIEDFPRKDDLKSKIEQFRKDLEDLRKGGVVVDKEEEETEDEEEPEEGIDILKQKFISSVIKILEAVISIHGKLKGTEPVVAKKEPKYKIGDIYVHTNAQGVKKKVKLLSFTDQLGTGPDKKFLTKDDIIRNRLEKKKGKNKNVFVEFLDDNDNSLPNRPTMAVDISTLTIDPKDTNVNIGASNNNDTHINNESFIILESIDDPKAKEAYDNILKYDKSSNIGTYVKSIQAIIDGSKEDKSVGFEWAGIMWPAQGTTNAKIITLGRQLVWNLKTVGKPLEIVSESYNEFNDVNKSLSLFCRPILGLKSSNLVDLMEGISDDIKSIIESFDSIIKISPKISEEKKVEEPKSDVKEYLLSSYTKFIKINEADEAVSGATASGATASSPESDSDKEKPMNPVFKAYKNNFTEEDEAIWIATKEKKAEIDSKFKNVKINIDTSGRVDPIVRIANIFGDAYKLFMVEQIPSGRPNGRVSQKTWREYKYLGKGTGDWTPDRGPNGPFAAKAIFKKWEKGVMSIIEDQKLRKIFANPNLSINGNPGAGQTLFTFMNDMLEDDALKDYDGARRRLLLKYFNISDAKNLNEAQTSSDGKPLDPNDVGDSGQTRLIPMSPFSIRRADIDSYEHSYLLLNYKNEKDKGELMLMYFMGSFFDNDGNKVTAFKYQINRKDIFKYLGVMDLIEPKDDEAEHLSTGGPIGIGFITDFPLNTEMSFKRQDLITFVEGDLKLEDRKIKVLKAYTLSVVNKNKLVMNMVKINKDITDKFRPKNDRSFGLRNIGNKYNGK